MDTDAGISIDVRDAIVYVVDDDGEMREALTVLLLSVDIRVEAFNCIGDFLAFDMPGTPSCLILDVRLKGQSGLSAQEQIARDLRLPIIFITGHGDVEMSVQAMKAGAVDFIEKPFRAQKILDAITAALASDRTRREVERSVEAIRYCYNSLTQREREVMALVVRGFMNKQIAAELKVSVITVKIHRGQAMKKMESRSLADFVLKASALGLNNLCEHRTAV